MLASRLEAIVESRSVSASNRAAELKRSGKKIFNFGIGEPDFTTPRDIIDAAFKAANEGKTHYTPSLGIPELREAIASKEKSFNGIQASPGNVLVTPTKFAINLAVMCLINPGDEVIIPEPYYLSYPDIVRLYGGKVITVPTTEDYEFDFELMEKLVSPRTRMVILSNPTNPTGKVYTEKALRNLSDFVLKHGLYLVSDEIYEDLIYEGKMFSPASIPEMFPKTITLSGFSKSYAMTGWRIGYMVAPDEIIKASNKIQQQTMTCASSISQYGALAALSDRESPAKFREIFRSRRDNVYKLISETEGISMRKPEGAFYAFVKYENRIPSEDFCEKALEKSGIVITPGSAFGNQGEYHFRLSFATDNDTIRDGIAELGRFVHSLPK
jgi:aspartate aminotransferase